MSKTLSITFGFLAPKMAKQLKAQGYRLPPRHIADEMNIAISSLALAGLLTEGQKHAARKKLVARITRDLIPIRRRATPTGEKADDERRGTE